MIHIHSSGDTQGHDSSTVHIWGCDIDDDDDDTHIRAYGTNQSDDGNEAHKWH